MSFRVLVIPEDPTWNGYILKPLAKRLLADAGKPLARVALLANPGLRGSADAIRAIREELPDSYRFFDLWLFFPDADRASPDAPGSRPPSQRHRAALLSSRATSRARGRDLRPASDCRTICPAAGRMLARILA